MRSHYLFLATNQGLIIFDRDGEAWLETDRNLSDKQITSVTANREIILAGTSGYDHYERAGRLRPSGVYGFEGKVDYADQRTAWVAEVMTGVCHSLLKATGDKNSPLYWRHAQGYHRFRQVNNALVDCFQDTLKQAWDSSLPEVKQTREQMTKNLYQLVTEAAENPFNAL